jgi:hypothetical protein
MNIFTGGRGYSKKFNVPYGSQDEPNDDNASGKLWSSEQLTDG